MMHPSARSRVIRLNRSESELIRIALFEYVYYKRYTDEKEKELALEIRRKVEPAPAYGEAHG